MRFYVFLLIAFLSTHTLAYAECNTPVDCYKDAIIALQNARAEIDKLRKQAAKDAETIKNLRESAEETDGQINALLTQLDTTAEQVAKLTEVVSVSEDGNVGIGTTNPKAKLHVNGDIYAGNSAIYFNKTNHNHSGIGNTNGFAAIENAANHNALMILGRTGQKGIRRIKLWDTVYVHSWIEAQKVVERSDQRHKQNIHTLSGSLAKIAQLRGVHFNWKDNPEDKQIGLVAQEVEKVFPELVSTDSEGYKSIAYGKLTAVLIEAIKELEQQRCQQ